MDALGACRSNMAEGLLRAIRVGGVGCEVESQDGVFNFLVFDGGSIKHGRVIHRSRFTRGDWSLVVSDDQKRVTATLHLHSEVLESSLCDGLYDVLSFSVTNSPLIGDRALEVAKVTTHWCRRCLLCSSLRV